jgi:putative tricarboxylic transport membrane protein
VDLLILGLRVLMNPGVLLWIFLGVTVGVIFGALPGVSATMAIILCIGFTYTMNPVVAIAFLAAVYCSAVTGGGITAILFKIPGTPSSAATMLDGYPMTQKGEAGRALSISLFSSCIGGLFSAIAMFALTQPLMRVALKFSSVEMFFVCFLGLSLIVFLDHEHMLNTFASAVIGLWLGTVGVDKTSVPRFTFGSHVLLNGVEALSITLGMFALVEVFREMMNPGDRSLYDTTKQADISRLVSLKEMLHLKWTMLRSAIIGTLLGIMPGAGATISSWMAYTVENKVSRHPEEMGNGDPHGIAASETANNAATGGAMVPLLAMGVPGSNAAAMMMSALAIHGVQMGPLLLKAQPEFLCATFISMILANILMVLVSFVVAKLFARILSVPYWILGSFIVVLAFTGGYARINAISDLWMVVFGAVFGYFFKKYNFNSSAMFLGLVLGPLVERHFRRGLQLSQGSLTYILNRPIAVGLLVVIVCMYVYGFYSMRRAKKGAML